MIFCFFLEKKHIYEKERKIERIFFGELWNLYRFFRNVSQAVKRVIVRVIERKAFF